jgi:hypothetical protein
MISECQTRFVAAPSEAKAAELAIKEGRRLPATYAQAQKMLWKAQSRVKGYCNWQIYAIRYTIEIKSV